MMVRQNCIPLNAPAEWKEALKDIKHAFAHTWENCYAMQLTTGLNTYLYCFEEENIRIVCPISERPFNQYADIVTPYGFSGFAGSADYAGFPCFWKQFVKERGYVCGYIGLNPVFENNSYFEPDEAYLYNAIYVLDLTLSPEELYTNLSTNRKRQLNNWDEILCSVVLEKPTVTDFLLTNYLAFFRRKNASPVYSFSLDTLSFLVGLDNILIVGIQKAGRVVAVSVFTYTSHVGEYLFNVSLPEGKQHSVALLWYAVTYLKSLQIPLLNLGGGVRENDGVAQFKERFGAMKLPLKCLKQVYEPEIYGKLCQMVYADPNDRRGYFPSYRRP
jgi:hypothetical protein